MNSLKGGFTVPNEYAARPPAAEGRWKIDLLAVAMTVATTITGLVVSTAAPEACRSGILPDQACRIVDVANYVGNKILDRLPDTPLAPQGPVVDTDHHPVIG
jgi:hypothetical protein